MHQKIKMSNSLHGRGSFFEQKKANNGIANSCGFREAHRPLIPSSIADIGNWEPKVMDFNGISNLAARCVGVTDSFIKLDNYLDSIKKFNPSNHDLLRMQRINKISNDPGKYTELIIQCVANPNKFAGTRHCLELVIGRRALAEFIARNEWTNEKLKENEINIDWKSEPADCELASSIPMYNGPDRFLFD